MKRLLAVSLVLGAGFFLGVIFVGGSGHVKAGGAGAVASQNGDVNGDGHIDDADTLLWNDAITYCENLSFAGHDDWRLPQQRELFSIVDVNRTGLAIDPVFGALSSPYWSSLGDGPPDVAWYVEFYFGTSKPVLRSVSLHFVRAVRNGP